VHLKRLYIRGFRSIRELDLAFTAGKNVIIGRNNSGKSNIVRALDVVLGESAPAYAKSENITETDFHFETTLTADGEVVETPFTEMFIWCELEREAREVLNWADINKCFGYSFYGQRQTDAPAKPIRILLEDLSKKYRDIFAINEDMVFEKVWVDSKLKNQNKFKDQLDPMFHFAYAFRAVLTESGIQKDLRFLYRESEDQGWVLAFKASVRTELLQSAILPAFRDPTTQLRLSQWTWFGKLMRHLTKDCKNDPDLQEALAGVQKAGDKLFLGITTQIESDALSVSFPDAKLSIQFHGETDAELYKNCGIYVDDGFKSPLVDKGAGIQSATIIGLFSFYVRNVNTRSSALLCVEEPELYLHPTHVG
jgi:energy-coupling factor transporter ATP-binding protein EcfA2